MRCPARHASEARTPGVGSPHHLAPQTFRSALSTDIKHIPYRGGAELVESVLRGDTHFSMVSLAAISPFVKAGKLKMLAVSIPNRLKQIPDVPTVAEATGLKDFSFPDQSGFLVKAGTPQLIVERLSATVRKAASQQDLYARVLEVTGSELMPTTPEQMSELIRGDIPTFGNAVRISDAKSQ